MLISKQGWKRIDCTTFCNSWNPPKTRPKRHCERKFWNVISRNNKPKVKNVNQTLMKQNHVATTKNATFISLSVPRNSFVWSWPTRPQHQSWNKCHVVRNPHLETNERVNLSPSRFPSLHQNKENKTQPGSHHYHCNVNRAFLLVVIILWKDNQNQKTFFDDPGVLLYNRRKGKTQHFSFFPIILGSFPISGPDKNIGP